MNSTAVLRSGIPDEGVLIERVEEEADQWVTVQGKGGDRNDLWNAGDVYSNAGDGIQVFVESKIDDDNYLVLVTYDPDSAIQPDVMLYPWTSPPGDTWETTDIWIDSPANGYNTYRYGTWNDLSGNLVPIGNGDQPTIGQVNRLYARVRNNGGAPASNVVVHFEITDPPGMGINDDTSWVSLGTVDSTDFPLLGNIDPDEFVDVYVEWTPDYDIPDNAVEDGNFAFHTCLRVRLDTVAGETVLGNQDGDREQENVSYFSVSDGAGMSLWIRLSNCITMIHSTPNTTTCITNPIYRRIGGSRSIRVIWMCRWRRTVLWMCRCALSPVRQTQPGLATPSA